MRRQYVKSVVIHTILAVPMMALGLACLWYVLTSPRPGEDWPGFIFFGICFCGSLYILMRDVYYCLMWRRKPAAARRWFREYSSREFKPPSANNRL